MESKSVVEIPPLDPSSTVGRFCAYIAETLDGYDQERNVGKQSWDGDYSHVSSHLQVERPRYANGEGWKAPRLCVKWQSGGVTGGSCWDEGESHHQSVSGEASQELTSLDVLLERLCPTLGFLPYRGLVRDVVKTHTFSVDEYYGNSSDYTYLEVEIAPLMEALKGRGLLPQEFC